MHLCKMLDNVLDDDSTCPFCSCVTFFHGCGLKKCMCGISLPCLNGPQVVLTTNKSKGGDCWVFGY